MSAGALHGMVLILGGRGAGKSYLLAYVERMVRRRGGRSVIWDRLGHYKRAPRRVLCQVPSAELAAQRAIREAPCTFFCDEAALAYPSGNPPREDSALLEIALVGRQAAAFGPWRRRGPVALVAATQRPAMIHTNVKNLLDRLILMHFPPTALHDLKWIAEATRSEEHAEACTRLAPGQYIVVDCQ